MIKRSMSHWALKCAEHRTPTRPSAPIVTMVETTRTAGTRRRP
ncbi:hypothetical protein [Streptomyces sp. NPDC048462]